MNDITKYFIDFLKFPLLPSQNAKIICAVIDGTITRATAKQLLTEVIDSNIEKYKEFINMSEEEILTLVEKVKERNNES